MGRLLTIEEVRGIGLGRGYTLVSEAYKSKTRLKWACPNGHVFELRIDGIRAGQGCKFCTWPKRSEWRKVGPVTLRKVASDRGGRVDVSAYIDSHTPIVWWCADGHRFEMSYSNVKGSHWCPVCASSIKSIKMKEIWKNRAEDPEMSRIDRNRDIEMRSHYGLKFRDYEKMVIDQDGLCAICKKPPYGKKGRLCVDHDHSTGLVRGLLCHRCNLAIGQFDDVPELLEAGASYLRLFCVVK